MSLRSGNLRLLQVGLLAVLLLALSGIWSGPKAQSSYRLGTSWQSWTYQTRSGDVTLGQWEVPLTVTHDRGPWTTSLELAFVSNDSDAPGGATASLSGLGRANLQVRRRWREGRLWTFAEVRHSGLVAEVDPGQLRLVEILESPELSLPFNSADFGDQMRGGLLAQLVRRSNLLLQAGAEFRWRGAFALREDGLEVNPGEEFRLGLSVDHHFRGILWRHGLWREVLGVTDIDGSPAYSTGARWRWESRLQKRLAHFDTGAELSLLWSEDGQLETDRFLDGSSLRSGNRLVTGFWITRPAPALTWTASLHTTQFRGFAGSLGRSSRLVPGFGITRPLGRGQLHLNVNAALGSLREEESLSGLGLNLAWVFRGRGS